MYHPCSFSECDCFTKHSVNDCYGNSSLVDGRMSGRLVGDGGGYETCGSGQDGTFVGWEEDSCRDFTSAVKWKLTSMFLNGNQPTAVFA